MSAGGLHWLIGSFGLLFGLLAAFSWWWTREVRTPVREKLLRPPGESLRRELESIDEKLVLWIGAYALGSTLVAIIPVRATDRPIRAVLGAATLVFLAIAAIHLMILLKRRRDFAIGFSGERLVGEELGRLAAEGFQVFHDFPTGTIGNIDHVVVAQSGVFAVETKTRRKGRGAKDQPNYIVVLDGYTLSFPHGKDSRGLQQAKRNADWLSAYLTKATGEPTTVEAVLTLPGWFIDRRGKGAVRVLSQKEFRSGLAGAAIIAPEQLQRIAHQLDQRCRDVEF